MTRSPNLAVTLTLCLAVAACTGKPEPQAKSEDGAESAEQRTAKLAVITPEHAKAAGLETMAAGPAEIRETLTLYGSIRPNAEHQQEVRARYPGIVRNVAKRPGDAVAKDELLLSVESNDSLEPYAIRSPIAGTVLDRRVNPGEAIDGSSTLLVVADLSTVWAEFAVFTRDLVRVRAGLTVLVHAGEGQAAGTAKVAYVAPSGSADTQSVLARAVLDNKGRQWVAGQFVTGDVIVERRTVSVAVMSTAVQKLGNDTVVFVQTDQGFEARKIEVGTSDAAVVEVRAGLSAGERYVAKNSYVVKAELTKGAGEED